MQLCRIPLSALVLLAAACSDPKPPPAAPAKSMAPVSVAVAPAEERPAEDQAKLARALAALGAPQAAQPAPVAAAPAKRKVRRPLAAAPAEDDASSSEYVDPTRLSDAQFQNAIGNWRGVKACIAQLASKRGDSDPSGALKIAFTISGQGEVVTSKVYDFSNDSARAVADCVEREAKRVKFPAFTAEERIIKEAKFVF